MGKTLYSKTKNKIFKDVTPEGFTPVFQKLLEDEKSKLTNPQIITRYYEGNGYDPVLVMDHIITGDLDAAYFQLAYEHGLNPKMFQADEIAGLITKINTKKSIKTLAEAYHDLAELELLTANALINYSNAMQYGVINPQKIYNRYFIETQRPDTATIANIFHIAKYKTYLDSIQPKNPQYITLQKALKDSVQAPGMSAEETKRIIIVNLERLRWKNKPDAKKYVLVNIPDYRLDVFKDGKSVLNMKVCVGQGRNMDNAKTLVRFDDTDRIDHPGPHETPMLNSLIHSVEVNPVWNIPKSIANKEIMVEAARDKFYLDNKGIDVYKNGKLVGDPEDIDWSVVEKDGTYEFKQKPGDENSLGKIKFLFNNKSSVYLHDTPAKLAFSKPMRAVSHGCVRVGDPKGLALDLFGPGSKYDMISKYMEEDRDSPTNISLSPKVPVYITYITCWGDETGTMQVRKDVYGLDIVLYANMQKMII